MCGIVAQVGNVNTEMGHRMLSRLSHRGPDDHGSLQVGEAWLGHRRLSIVDIDGGIQPLPDARRNLWLIGNGEIYNHEKVRTKLDGTLFTTRSDNEVALQVFDVMGPDALTILRGMYALVIAGSEGQFVAARDPLGIKPLYWARRDETVIFASELQAFDSDWRPYVEVFPPGYYWTPENGFSQFVDIASELKPNGSNRLQLDQGLLDGIKNILIRAVENEMMSDVPVGVLLSGGLDSSLVASIAAQYYALRGQRLKTFSIGTKNSPDLEAARQVAKHLDTEHHERVYTLEEALERLPEVVQITESFDPALIRSAVANYFVAKLASEHVKVVLTGEGADEIFGGYSYMEDFTDPESLQTELVRTLKELHGSNLQRCDRTTMVHGLEARVPFLDLEVIRLCLSIPPESKIIRDGQPEKQMLRQAFEGWLPSSLLWRKKDPFHAGSGTTDMLQDYAEASISEVEFESLRNEVEPPLRTKEEATYYKIFSEHLAGIAPSKTISRSMMHL